MPSHSAISSTDSTTGQVLFKEPVHLVFQELVFRCREPRVRCNEGPGRVAGLFENVGVFHHVRNAQFRKAMLPTAEEVAGAAKCKVCPGDFEAVGGLTHDPEAVLRLLALIVGE